MVKMLFRFYRNILRLYSTNTTSTYSPVLISGWRSRCIYRGRGQSCSAASLNSGRASFSCRNVSPIFCWSSEFVLLSPSKLASAREVCVIHVSTGSCVTSLLGVSTAGVPNGAARQNTRSTGQNSAGWEIEHLPHALAGKSI